MGIKESPWLIMERECLGSFDARDLLTFRFGMCGSGPSWGGVSSGSRCGEYSFLCKLTMGIALNYTGNLLIRLCLVNMDKKQSCNRDVTVQDWVAVHIHCLIHCTRFIFSAGFWGPGV